MNAMFLSRVRFMCYANDNSAFIPEKWAAEGLAILVENMVMANLVNRDFENEVANFGDVVNTRKVATTRIQRKSDSDDVEAQDASATNVQVKLDQHFYQSFIIKDGEATLSFTDLVQTHLLPRMQTMARAVDVGLLGQVHKFIRTPSKRAGRLQNISSSTAKDWIVDANEILNINRAYQDGRNLVLAPTAQSAFLKTDLFVQAQQRGDGGSALERAVLGSIYGFNTVLSQNTPYVVLSATDTKTGTVTNALAQGADGSQAVSIASYVVTPGEFAVVAGNDQPTYITNSTDDATNTSAITLNEANKYATSGSAVVTVYKKAAVNGSYSAGHVKEILIDGWTNAPSIGQLIAFDADGSHRHTYTIIESYLSSAGVQAILLDRPLEIALSNNDDAFPGPAGSMNFAFHRNALALVTRPLAQPPAATGVMSSVSDYNNVAMRVTLQYDSSKQGTRCNLDLLAGYAVLDQDLACVLLG